MGNLPERYGPVGTVSSRFYRWRQAGLWDYILATLQMQADQAGTLDWSIHYVDGTTVRAHQHTAGAKKKRSLGAPDEALGRSRDGFTTQIHLRAEG